MSFFPFNLIHPFLPPQLLSIHDRFITGWIRVEGLHRKGFCRFSYLKVNCFERYPGLVCFEGNRSCLARVEHNPRPFSPQLDPPSHTSAPFFLSDDSTLQMFGSPFLRPPSTLRSFPHRFRLLIHESFPQNSFCLFTSGGLPPHPPVHFLSRFNSWAARLGIFHIASRVAVSVCFSCGAPPSRTPSKILPDSPPTGQVLLLCVLQVFSCFPSFS